MDLVLRLRELRRIRGMSQKDVAKRSGVGEKTISSFETGQRVGSLKISQLRKLLTVYGVTEGEFFSGALDRVLAPWDAQGQSVTQLLGDLRGLPDPVQNSLMEKFQLMVETATDVRGITSKASRASRESSDWQMLTSRN